MGLLKDFVQLATTRPPRPAQIAAVRGERLGAAVLDLLIFMGEETPWQPPLRATVATRVPGDTYLARGMVLTVQGVRDRTNPWRVVWDAPQPQLPPMRFPQVPGGDDPKVMLEHLRWLVQTGALPQEGYDAAEAYLQDGWPVPGS